MVIYRASGLSEAALTQYAEAMAEHIHAPALLSLEGDLGAGKTTFARGWIRSVTGEGDIPSPTFSLVQEYCCHADLALYHMDVYRLKTFRDLEELGFQEMLSSGICLVEWLSKIPQGVSEASTPMAVLRLDCAGAETRDIHLETTSPLWCAVVESLGMEKLGD